ncbi:MAG: hypothetical protein PHW46_04455 [Candidatus Omnitrophica bacterium]|nr:hypothetical protein [Candidatus Omnitrophota bacterium]
MMFNLTKKKNGLLFGDIAVNKGLATQKEIDEALVIQKEYEKRNRIHKEIGAILTEKGILTPKDVKKILEEQRSHRGLVAWFTAFFNLTH